MGERFVDTTLLSATADAIRGKGVTGSIEYKNNGMADAILAIPSSTYDIYNWGLLYVTNISVTHMPNKISYNSGDVLDLTGLEITATYSDGNNYVVTNYITIPSNGSTLTARDSNIIVSYTDDGITVTTSFNLTIIGSITKVDSVTELSVARAELAATTVGNYGLFGGGYGEGTSNRVDAYNTSLTRSTPTALSRTVHLLTATTVGNYGLFGGGDPLATSDTVNAYNTSLTRSIPGDLSQGRSALAATTIGNYALFGGGGQNTSYTTATYYSTVDAYNTSLTRSTRTALSQARFTLAATTAGNYALFGGGQTGSMAYSSRVDAYNTSLTRSTPTALSQARHALAATTVGDYGLFGGGRSSNVVDAYNTSLTRSTPTALSQARSGLAATTVGNYGLFGGGSGPSNIVDSYNASLTRSTPTALSQARNGLEATTVGNYGLFGGGYGSGYSNVVDAYTVI